MWKEIQWAEVMKSRLHDDMMKSRLQPLHDAVRINCKKGTTIENQGSGVKYMG